ncbi:hypothetical protein EV200_1181, partial [Pedobacter psychrotolerans]
ATRLAGQIHKEFGVRIGLQELFTHVVLAEQANELNILLWASKNRVVEKDDLNIERIVF